MAALCVSAVHHTAFSSHQGAVRVALGSEKRHSIGSCRRGGDMGHNSQEEVIWVTTRRRGSYGSQLAGGGDMGHNSHTTTQLCNDT